MTEKLFYLDSHLQRFSAQVEQCVPDGENWQIVLDRTAFFPEGGGQYADTGILGSARVLDVQEKDGVIFHRTDAPLSVGDCVEGRIDWDLRFMKMHRTIWDSGAMAATSFSFFAFLKVSTPPMPR